MVASWACEVTEILDKEAVKKPSFVWGLEWPLKPNNQLRVPDIHISVSAVYDTLEIHFSCIHVHIV